MFVELNWRKLAPELSLEGRISSVEKDRKEVKFRHEGNVDSLRKPMEVEGYRTRQRKSLLVVLRVHVRELCKVILGR